VNTKMHNMETCPTCKGSGMAQNGEDIDVCPTCFGTCHISRDMTNQFEQAQAAACPTCVDTGEIPF